MWIKTHPPCFIFECTNGRMWPRHWKIEQITQSMYSWMRACVEIYEILVIAKEVSGQKLAGYFFSVKRSNAQQFTMKPGNCVLPWRRAIRLCVAWERLREREEKKCISQNKPGVCQRQPLPYSCVVVQLFCVAFFSLFCAQTRAFFREF